MSGIKLTERGRRFRLEDPRTAACAAQSNAPGFKEHDSDAAGGKRVRGAAAGKPSADHDDWHR